MKCSKERLSVSLSIKPDRKARSLCSCDPKMQVTDKQIVVAPWHSIAHRFMSLVTLQLAPSLYQQFMK
jgi:hypothetical protein